VPQLADAPDPEPILDLELTVSGGDARSFRFALARAAAQADVDKLAGEMDTAFRQLHGGETALDSAELTVRIPAGQAAQAASVASVAARAARLLHHAVMVQADGFPVPLKLCP
jgi:hypothetical protein